MNSIFLGYEDHKGTFSVNPHGSLIASEAGESNSYGLIAAQSRGQLFIGPQVEVYAGMVVGENAKDDDIEVNICRTKELTNFRTKNFGVQEGLEVPRLMSLEDAMDYIGEDELVEITPNNIRIRKMSLNKSERERIKKKA